MSVVYMTGQGVPAGYFMAQGPGGVPVAMPVQQAGGVVTFPGSQPHGVQMVQVSGQPQAYQVSTTGGFGGQPQTVPGMQGTQMDHGAEGGQIPPPYVADNQVSTMYKPHS